MTQKIVLKVQMSTDRCRSKAMALVAAMPGVDSVALAGDARDQVVVAGDGVDPVKLTSALRRKVGPAQLVQVGNVKKEEEKKPVTAAAEVIEYQWQSQPGYYYPYHYQWQPEPVNVAYEKHYSYSVAAAGGYVYPCSRPEPDTCSIM